MSNPKRADLQLAATGHNGSTCFSGSGRGSESNDVLARRNRLLERQNRQLQLEVQRFRQLAYVDGLTGLVNRRYLEMALESEIRRASRTLTPLTFVLCDVDRFKHYNDTYGHQCGDDVLIKIAETICRQCRRAGDVAARYGGEEFALLLPGAGSKKEGIAVSENLRRSVARLSVSHECHGRLQVTISLGVTMFLSGKPCTAKAIIEAADTALYRAKRRGRDCTEYEPLAVRGCDGVEPRARLQQPPFVHGAVPREWPSEGWTRTPDEVDEAGVLDILTFGLQRPRWLRG